MQYKIRLAVMALLTALAACGDGGSDGPRTSAVRVVGDSLNDSGTFGFKFTVQDNLNGTRIWTDHVAAAVGVGSLCARYVATGADRVVPNPSAANCTAYGVGRARINVPPDIAAGDASPFSIVQQLKDMTAAAAFGPEELLLVDGGGNDVADLMRGYLTLGAELQTLVPFADTRLVKLLGELLTPTQLQAVLQGGEPVLAAAGAQYMEALANLLADQLATQALDQGSRRVVVLNIPPLSRTPYFQAMLVKVAQDSGGGDAGAAVAAYVQAIADGWIQAFNSRLKLRFASERRVAVVDLYAALAQWVDSPSSYGFSNAKDPACPPTGVPDALGLPAYVLGNCLAWSLSAYPPPAATGPDWWHTYVFADDYHGTPRTNELIGELVTSTLRARNWL